jgi:DNA-binding Lrp family transcriptional regulator
MANSHEIDEFERKILKVLYNNPREKTGVIAKDLGISATAVTKRIEVLKKKGVITGTTVSFDEELLGFPLTAVLVAKVQFSCKMEIVQAIKEKVAARDDLVLSTCQVGIGHYDILVGIHAKNKYVLDEMRRFVEGLPGVRGTAVYNWLEMPFFKREKLFETEI